MITAKAKFTATEFKGNYGVRAIKKKTSVAGRVRSEAWMEGLASAADEGKSAWIKVRALWVCIAETPSEQSAQCPAGARLVGVGMESRNMHSNKIPE